MSGPFAGVRVVEIASVLSGPLAAALLAEQGALVVKVEPPGTGDLLRWVGSARGGVTGTFQLANRGKRGVAIDLATPRGVEIVCRLAERSDVLIQNYRPGVAERLGFGWEQLSARNPRLVYLSISGFGPKGPLAQGRAYDNVIQAQSGMNAAQRDPASGDAQPLRQLVCDKLTGWAGAQAVSAALYARERTGRGQHVELSMLDTAIAFLWPDVSAEHAFVGPDASRQPAPGSDASLLRLADGFATATPFGDAEFEGLCRALGLSEVAADPRFATTAARMQNVAALSALFRNELALAARALTRAEFARALAAEDVPAGVVVGIGELAQDPQVVASGTLVETDHPRGGRMREARPAPRFAATPARAGGPAPGLGEHTDEVLAELGLGAEIAELRAEGVVA